MLIQEAIPSMDSVRKNKKPFLLYMAHYTVHIPIISDITLIQKYNDAGLGTTQAKYASTIEGIDKSFGYIMKLSRRKKY
ncbi:hypothetical protein SAMN05443667_11278 [Flavobacterium gillisiae]|uniref:Sulfatase n=1 Tax=Flavobacterium gillisiae TaxID=150146 RepID=A0A1H4F9M5_9FLAO|nr:hypothetical protein SAMN05443667_11278 [Flavobacterium gillisiae]